MNVSGFYPPYKPDYCLDELTDTYWMVESPELAEVTINLKGKFAVSEIGVMASTFSSSPKTVTVLGYAADKTYEILVERSPLKMLKKRHWQRVVFEPTVTRYIKLLFENNFGDPDHIAVREITVIRARESKLTSTI
jgi:hypothetical protein